MLGIKRITGAAGSAPEGEPGSWVSDAAREKFMAAYERAFALWPQPCEEFDIETATRRWRMRSRGGNCSALAKGGLERGTPNVSVRELLDLEHDLAVIGALQHETVGVAGLLHRQGVSDFGMQFALFNPRLHGLQTAANQIVVLGQDAEPQAVRAKTFGHHDASVELLALSSRGAVDDDAPKGAAAAQAFGRMLTAQHLEDGVHTLAVGQLLNLLLVIRLAVVDAVIQPEFFYSFQFFFFRRDRKST